jgi:hemoglobin
MCNCNVSMPERPSGTVQVVASFAGACRSCTPFPNDRRHTMYSELNRTSITILVDDFYTDIRRENMLQPIFDRAIGTNWEPHLERMVDFWCSVMLTSGDFKGNVFGKHMQLQGLEMDHFRRWLSLFETHVRRLFHSEVAEEFMLVARRIAASLQYGYFGRADVA